MTRKEKLLVGKLISYTKANMMDSNLFKEELKKLIKEVEYILRK